MRSTDAGKRERERENARRSKKERNNTKEDFFLLFSFYPNVRLSWQRGTRGVWRMADEPSIRFLDSNLECWEKHQFEGDSGELLTPASSNGLYERLKGPISPLLTG